MNPCKGTSHPDSSFPSIYLTLQQIFLSSSSFMYIRCTFLSAVGRNRGISYLLLRKLEVSFITLTTNHSTLYTLDHNTFTSKIQFQLDFQRGLFKYCVVFNIVCCTCIAHHSSSPSNNRLLLNLRQQLCIFFIP